MPPKAPHVIQEIKLFPIPTNIISKVYFYWKNVEKKQFDISIEANVE